MDRRHGVKVKDIVLVKNSESNETCTFLTFYFTNIPENIVHEDLR
jgi:hypothetical protein